MSDEDKPYRVQPLDFAARAAAKAASREEDARQLAAGETTPAELRRRNGVFSSLGIRMPRWVMVAIGGKPLRRKPPEDL